VHAKVNDPCELCRVTLTLRQHIQHIRLMVETHNPSPQQVFDDTYVSTMEICEEMGVNRASVTNAIKRKFLPAPIVVSHSHMHLWVRREIRPILDAWKLVLKARQAKETA